MQHHPERHCAAIREMFRPGALTRSPAACSRDVHPRAPARPRPDRRPPVMYENSIALFLHRIRRGRARGGRARSSRRSARPVWRRDEHRGDAGRRGSGAGTVVARRRCWLATAWSKASAGARCGAVCALGRRFSKPDCTPTARICRAQDCGLLLGSTWDRLLAAWDSGNRSLLASSTTAAALPRPLDALRHSGDFRPPTTTPNYGPAWSPTGRALANSCVLSVNLV